MYGVVSRLEGCLQVSEMATKRTEQPNTRKKAIEEHEEGRSHYMKDEENIKTGCLHCNVLGL